MKYKLTFITKKKKNKKNSFLNNIEQSILPLQLPAPTIITIFIRTQS